MCVAVRLVVLESCVLMKMIHLECSQQKGEQGKDAPWSSVLRQHWKFEKTLLGDNRDLWGPVIDSSYSPDTLLKWKYF